MANDKLSPRKQPVQERSRDLVEAVLEATRRLLVDEGFLFDWAANIATLLVPSARCNFTRHHLIQFVRCSLEFAVLLL